MIHRIKGILLQDIYSTRHSFEIFTDVFLFPSFAILVFGLMTRFLSLSTSLETAQFLLLGSFIWEYFRLVQYTVTFVAMWNLWSRNLTNIFITPISNAEFIIASSISGFIKGFLYIIIANVITVSLYDFNIFSIGITTFIFGFLNIWITAIVFGMFVMGLIFRFGTKINSVAWGFIYFLQPITAVFFPVSVLPKAMQYISLSMPHTHVFEAARYALVHKTTDWHSLSWAFGLNIVYLIGVSFVFNYFFTKSKITGQFARNEG